MEIPNTTKLPNVGPVQFIKEVVAELKKVNWPTREETVKLTAVVFVISAAVAAFIGALDAFMINLTGILFKR